MNVAATKQTNPAGGVDNRSRGSGRGVQATAASWFAPRGIRVDGRLPEKASASRTFGDKRDSTPPPRRGATRQTSACRCRGFSTTPKKLALRPYLYILQSSRMCHTTPCFPLNASLPSLHREIRRLSGVVKRFAELRLASIKESSLFAPAQQNRATVRGWA